MLERVPTDDDLNKNGAAHLMVWGRHHTKKWLMNWRQRGRPFVCDGTSTCRDGLRNRRRYDAHLASDHDHGVALPIDLAKMDNSLDTLIEQIVPLAAVTI